MGTVTIIVLALLVQFGARLHAGGGLAGPVVLVVVFAAAGGMLLPLLRVLMNRVHSRRRGLGGRRARIGRPGAARSDLDAERRARTAMGELCPDGWRAELTLYAGRALTESGEPVRAPVALDWYELQPGGTEPAVVRRVWAGSVLDALEAMVADRRTDVALEQIELRASADGASWPDT